MPPPQDGGQRRAPPSMVAAQNMAHSNSTSQFFLGNRQYAWMPGSHGRGDSQSILASGVQRPPHPSNSPLSSLLNADPSNPTAPIYTGPSGFQQPQFPSVQQLAGNLPSPAASEEHAFDVLDSVNNPGALALSTSATTSTEASKWHGSEQNMSTQNKRPVDMSTIDLQPRKRLRQMGPRRDIPMARDNTPTSPLISPGSTSAQSQASMNPQLARPNSHDQSDGPAPSVVRPFLTTKLEDFIKSRGGWDRLDNTEKFHITMLRSALQCEDSFVIYLHKIHCLASTDFETVQHLPGFEGIQLGGFTALTQLIWDTTKLAKDVVIFFQSFPPVDFTQMPPMLQVLFKQIAKFLNNFGAHWPRYHELALRRGCPPWPEELMDWFQVPSPTFHRIVFTLMHQRFVNMDQSGWSQEGEQLFAESQAALSQLKQIPRAPNWSFASCNQRIQRYLSLRKLAIANKSTSRSHNTGGMQQISVPTAREPSFPGVGHPPPVYHHQDDLGQLPLTNAFPGQQILEQTPVNGFQSAHGSTLSRYQQSYENMHGFVQPVNSAPNARLPNPGQPWMGHQTPTGEFPRGPRTMNNNGTSNTDKPPLSLRLIPVSGFELPQSTAPNPSRTALHQAYLNSPIARKMDHTGKEGPDIRMYQYLRSFVLPPTMLEADISFYQYSFTIPESIFSRKALLASGAMLTEPPNRLYRDGSYLFRLRCISGGRPFLNVSNLYEHEWNVRDNHWPSCCFVSLNGHQLELRRKVHHGRDLALDLTDFVMKGVNAIEFSILRSKDEEKNKFFAIAVEVIEIGDDFRVRNAIGNISPTESLSSVTRGLGVDDNDSDDLVVVDPHLSIDLVDPFTAKIFEKPARGRHCLHRECFDLETFLATRKSRAAGGPISPDEWKCPICRSDARPGSLVIDGFLQSVRYALEQRHNLDARAILVKPDGTWEAKVEGDATSDDGMGRDSTREPSVQGNSMAKEVGRLEVVSIIEIDDD